MTKINGHFPSEPAETLLSSREVYEHFCPIIYRLILFAEQDGEKVASLHFSIFKLILNDFKNYSPEKGRLFMFIWNIAVGFLRKEGYTLDLAFFRTSYRLQ